MINDEYSEDGSDVGRRAHHNKLERQRRINLKSSFHSLREVLPVFKGQKASRIQILRKAADFIQNTQRKNEAHRADIEDLKKENYNLEDQIRTLQTAIQTGNLEDADSMITPRSFYQHFGSASASSSSESEESDAEDDVDDTDSDDSSMAKCKRRKLNNKAVKRA